MGHGVRPPPGFDYASGEIADDVVEQAKQCFRNIQAALAQAGAGLEDLVRIRIYLADQADFDRVAPIIGDHCRAARPANTTVIAPTGRPHA